MHHESGGNAHAVNQNRGGSYDVGLWQVNSMNWNAWYDALPFVPQIRICSHLLLPSLTLCDPLLIAFSLQQRRPCSLRPRVQPEVRH